MATIWKAATANRLVKQYASLEAPAVIGVLGTDGVDDGVQLPVPVGPTGTAPAPVLLQLSDAVGAAAWQSSPLHSALGTGAVPGQPGPLQPSPVGWGAGAGWVAKPLGPAGEGMVTVLYTVEVPCSVVGWAGAG
jgi:hypothetical protein